MSSTKYLIKCVDARTRIFVGYLNDDGTTRRQKRGAGLFTESTATHEVRAINAYGKYAAEAVKA